MAHDHAHDHGTHEHGTHDHAHAHGDTHDGAAPVAACGHTADTSGLSAEDVTDCPVMPGSSVIKADAEAAGLFRDYDGARYWFCCDACGPLFDADPERYVTAV